MAKKVVALKYKPAGPVVTAFHNSDKKVRVLCGPFGSGKTTAVCMEIFKRATEMPVNKDNIRRSRWVAIRTTYPELHNTTIKTWRLWFGDAYGDFSWKEPCTHKIRVPFHDGSKIELDVVFMALDGPNCEMALSGSEWSGAWLNEMKEISRPVMETVLGRLRFPPEITLSGEPWRGVIGDTNAPDDDHYLYDFRENRRPEGWEFFWQPGGVKRDPDTSKWVLNPDAENLHNLPKGYYESQLSALSEDKIRVNLANEYGYVKDGRPVFPEYVDTTHAADVTPVRELPLYIGADFGLTPAGVIAQVNAHGQVIVLDEVVGNDIGAKRFGETLKDVVARKYTGFKVAQMWGDPAGKQRSQTDEVTVFQILHGMGLKFTPAPSQNPLHRREAVASALTTMIDGKPGFMIDRRCKMLRAALAGKYQYKKMLVSGERYAERPDKNEYSHICFVAGTPISTPFGDRLIESLRTGDLVDTPLGPRPVIATGSRQAEVLSILTESSIMSCTPDHPFWTDKGWIPACQLNSSVNLTRKDDQTQLASWLAQHERSRQIPCPDARRSTPSTSSWAPASIVAGITGRLSSALSISAFTNWYMPPTMATSHMGGPSTTSTATPRITTRKTLSPSTSVSTPNTTTLSGRLSAKLKRVAASLSRNLLRATGESAIQRPLHSLAASPVQNSGLRQSRHASSALGVNVTTKASAPCGSAAFAPCPARAWLARKAARTILTVIALFAARRSEATSTSAERRAPEIVAESYAVATVYNVTVADAHCYYAGGYLVSNCDALQYLMVGLGKGRASFLDTTGDNGRPNVILGGSRAPKVIRHKSLAPQRRVY